MQEAIFQLTNSLEQGQQTDAQQEAFLRLAEQQNTLDQKNINLSENFLAILISIISMKASNRFVLRSIKVLVNHLRNDANTFRAFKPNKPLLRKMDMGTHIMS